MCRRTEKFLGLKRKKIDVRTNGIIIHPRIGVPEEISYLSEAFFKVVKYVVQTARQLDMKVVLYDEGMYPSGSDHGFVAAENADYASKEIMLPDSVEGRQKITQLSDGKYLVYVFTHGTIHGIHYGEDDGGGECANVCGHIEPGRGGCVYPADA